MQSTFLNVQGEEVLLRAVQKCWASLFEPRAIVYRAQQGYDQLGVGLAVVVQRMVQSEKSGVMFTVEPVTNDGTRMTIEAIYGLGEAVVQGLVTPDLYIIEKGSLRISERRVSQQEWKLVRTNRITNELEEANESVLVPMGQQRRQKLTDLEILELAHLGRRVEEHYGHPQDIEWAWEREDLYILQSRPITTIWREHEEVKLSAAPVLATGIGASPGIASGTVKVLHNLGELDKLVEGDVLVTEMTTPDFVPAMKRACAIVTDRGGHTAHAAIVSRELGLPCVVGTGTATKVLKEGMVVTVHGTQGQVYEGRIDVVRKVAGPRRQVRTATKVYVNLADPEMADIIAKRQVDGVGLLRAEFMIAHIGEHPKYVLWQGRRAEWIDRLARGIESFAASFHPRPVVYRTSDFKSNEYRKLKGGERYEQVEENPMIGYRGAGRYVDDRDVFGMEVAALRRVLQRYDNLNIMVPFVRTPEELVGVKALLEEEGLRQQDGLVLWMMVEVPSNVILLDQFLDVGIQGVSIGSNDLTQLMLGVDRDSEKLRDLFDERHPTIMWCLERVVKRCVERGITCSICGQAPSFYPELTEKLVEWGITSVSVSPDMIDRTREVVAQVERKLGRLPQQVHQ
jgi:pyruvate,water dikinase